MANSGQSQLTSITLASFAGFVDTAVFIHMGGLFVAHVTGNFVLLGATLANANAGAAHAGSATLQLISFPIFFLAAMAAASASGLPQQGRASTLLWIVTALTGGVGIAALAGLRADAVLAMLLVVAMGVLNAAHRMDATLGAPFTVMTGNMTALAVEAAHVLKLAPRRTAVVAQGTGNASSPCPVVSGAVVIGE
jgi:uncharacterized membrane protein YoaK (UPF0700 family)